MRAAALAVVACAVSASSAMAFAPSRAILDRMLAKRPLASRADAPPVVREPLHGRAAIDTLAPAAKRELDALGWEAISDAGSGLPLRIWGEPARVRSLHMCTNPGTHMESGSAPTLDSCARTNAPADALAFLEARPALLGFRPGADGYALTAGAPFRAGPVTVVPIAQTWHGIPIEGVRADVRFALDGAPVMARLHLARGIDAATSPAIDDVEAASFAASAIAMDYPGAGAPRVDGLRIVRHGDAWRLAWAVRIDRTAMPPARLTVWIDALDGAALALRDDVRSGTVPTDTSLTLTAWHEPRRAGDPLVESPLPFVAAFDDQDSFVTGTDGVTTVPVSGTRALDLLLAGTYVRTTLTTGSSLESVQLDAGVPAVFVWSSGMASLSELDATLSHDVVRQRMKKIAPDIAFPDSLIGLLVDIPDPDGCNAFWDGDSGLFYEESEICNATGRLADVVYHEIGHGFHFTLATGGTTPGDIGEGSADYLAATINGDPDIAPAFFKATPNGLRNLEPDLVFPDDITEEAHHDGMIWGGAFWDLRTRLIATLGSDLGVQTADVIFADTLRFAPVMDDGFWDALLAADDDGNISNGGPFECDVVQAFGAHGLGPGNGLAVDHLPLGLQAPSNNNGYLVRAHVASAFPRCGGTAVDGARLEWRVDGGAWQSITMGADLVPGWRTATIPPQDEGEQIEYRLVATGADGSTATSPVRWFDLYPFAFRVSEPEVVFEDDFEYDLEEAIEGTASDFGWTHELVSGVDMLGADDWQRGTPLGRSGDPTRAFSGTNVWGNDLGADPFNGAYQGSIHNRLESPVIDCSDCSGARLQFRRWLGVEEQLFDVASVWVGSRKVWSNPLNERLRDREWRFEEVDISREADGKKFRLRFELKSDGGVQLGGWNIDDVRVTKDGDYDSGCSCALDRRRAVRPGTLVLCALVALFALRRRYSANDARNG